MPEYVKSLNGWQRIWCVVSLLWLLGVVGVTACYFPNQENSANLYAPFSQMDRPELASKAIDCVYVAKSHDAEKAKACQKEYTDMFMSGPSRDDRDRYDAYVDNAIYDLRVLAVKNSTEECLIPLALLYILGMAVAWIRLGFRKHPPREPAPDSRNE